MDPRNIVPEFKKRLGAVSVVVLSEDGTSILVCEDFEKGGRGQRRWSLPGGTVEESDCGDTFSTAIRELEEETGVCLSRNALVKIAFHEKFPNATKKEFFVALRPSGIPLRTTGTWQVIERNGERVNMQVLGPPEWVKIEDILVLPPRGYSAEDKWYLHYSHVRGLVEAILYLHALGLDKKHLGFHDLWSRVGGRISNLRRVTNPEAA